MATLILSVVRPLAFTPPFPFAVLAAIASPTQFLRLIWGQS